MNLKRLLGYFLISLPFGAIYLVLALKDGWLEAMLTFGIASALAACIWGGVMLSMKD